MAYNSETFAGLCANLVQSGEKAGNAAHAFAVPALLALIDNAETLDTIVAMLCGDAKHRAKPNADYPQGKPNPSKLPDATTRAWNKLKRAWENASLSDARGARALAVCKAYAGFLTDEQESDCEAAYISWLATPNKSGTARQDTDANRQRCRAAFIAVIYPDAPANFSAFDKAISKAIATPKAAALPDDDDGETENAPDGAKPVSAPDAVTAMMEYVAALDGDTLASVENDLANLAALIAAKLETLAAGQIRQAA